ALGVGMEQWRVRWAGAHAVDRDSVPGACARQRFREPDDAGFGCRVGRLAEAADPASIAGDEHDLAATGLNHGRKNRTRQAYRPQQVYPHDLVDELLRCLDERLRA